MEIQVTKLDKAFKTSQELSKNTVETSKKISQEFERIIKNMTIHWQGEDATLHINQWIEEYDKLSTYFTELKKTEDYFQNYFTNLQVCRSKTSSNTKVGDVICDNYEFNSISKIDTTMGYYFDEQLKNDYKSLQEVSKYYDEFISTVDSDTEEIFRDWKIGIGRKEVGDYCQKVSSYSKRISKDIHELNNKLAIAIYNIDKINI